ncbi:MAG: tetraacyldisaccharide 4'-kinase [Rubrivivax sp.]|jgi:tetraacyldisaccharide 4'-kinase|nr:tetraacyldisaccharide 4'-kinase [Rubrivivax sp.]
MTLAARAEAVLTRHWWRRDPTWLAWLLWPLSMVYLSLLLLHRRWHRPGQALPVPVLVVGNHVVGGAGKTPTVMAVVQGLRQAGKHPGVISRGHGRHAEAVQPVLVQSTAAEVGDEPLLIQRRCRVPVWVGRDRAAAGLALCQAHPEVDVLVSDDGLQHLGLPRQAELRVFDERGAGNGLLLPAGPLRDPLPVVVPPWARVLYTAGQASTTLPGALAHRHIHSAWPLQAWLAGDASRCQPLQSLRGQPLTAAAGMAAPEKFFAMLQAQGLTLQRLPLPDHHAYATLPWPADTADVITTEKDAVKLDPARLGRTRVWVVPLDLQLPAGLLADLIALLFPAP